MEITLTADQIIKHVGVGDTLRVAGGHFVTVLARTLTDAGIRIACSDGVSREYWAASPWDKGNRVRKVVQ